MPDRRSVEAGRRAAKRAAGSGPAAGTAKRRPLAQRRTRRGLDTPGKGAPGAPGKRKAGGQARFLAAAAGILLAGALTAGLAARAVVAPREGVRTSQPTPAIPTVLGQTAEELRFPPWNLYDSLALDGDLQPRYQEFVPYYFGLLGVRLGQDAPGTLPRAMVGNLGSSDHSQRAPLCLFLCDYPALLGSGEPVLLQYGEMAGLVNTVNLYGNYAVSFLVEPAAPRSLTEAEREAAQETVKQDLKAYLMLGEPVDFAPLLAGLMGADTYYAADLEEWFDGAPADETGRQGYPGESDLLARVTEEVPVDLVLCDTWSLNNRVYNLGSYFTVGRDFARAISPDGDPQSLSIEEFIDAQNEYHTYTIQLVSTPTQVVVLLGLNNTVAGIYYDIQLARYSGVGIYWG